MYCFPNNVKGDLDNAENVDCDSKNYIEEVMTTDKQICSNKNKIYNTKLHQSDLVYDNEIKISYIINHECGHKI